MKSFPWNSWLHQHTLFASLTAQEITTLLSDDVSQEHTYPQDQVIVQGGTEGDSLFLLGAGSVQVLLEGTKGPRLPVAIGQAGEIFGEMAVLERKPRSATVITREPCVVLEITGAAIRTLLDAHPALHVQLYTLMRDRLQQWFQHLGGET